MRVMSHVFHRAHAAGTLSIMWLRLAIPRLVFFPVLVLLIATSACSRYRVGPGTIAIRIDVAGGKGIAGLGIDHCRWAVDPNAVLKTITVRDENGTVLADTTLRGRDATAKKVGVNGRRCVVTAGMNVDVQAGASYEITADGETRTLDWPLVRAEDADNCWGGCYYYPRTAIVRFLARGAPEPADIEALLEQGYRRVSEISRMWNLPRARVKQIVKRDDFPAPAKVVGSKNLWLLEALEAWWSRDGRHAPNQVMHTVSTFSVDLPAARFGRNLRSPAALALDAASGRSTGSPTLREGG